MNSISLSFLLESLDVLPYLLVYFNLGKMEVEINSYISSFYLVKSLKASNSSSYNALVIKVTCMLTNSPTYV